MMIDFEDREPAPHLRWPDWAIIGLFLFGTASGLIGYGRTIVKVAVDLFNR
ncbi:hypothetical protein HL653_03655 [Sphingomonas sp. AP4-R1]|uniref:hypothetical protein n=1 Tax=Sphingomonas sp. AP4-R1 TaxID=2735134 RepID=UPI0014934211|nr:hypothetical protein [Sphingomonas sp. AP4-R1]QJU57002.1 hypothetical protein HL653_03655 [Sphingomonas sp. AP4-R1]